MANWASASSVRGWISGVEASGTGVGVASGEVGDAVGRGRVVAVVAGMGVKVGSGVGVGISVDGGTSVGAAVTVASPPQAAKTNIATRLVPIAKYLHRRNSWLIISPLKEVLHFSHPRADHGSHCGDPRDPVRCRGDHGIG